MVDDQLNIGIVGLGSHGKNHVAMLQGMGHQVLGVDVDPENRFEFEQKFDGETYETPSKLYNSGIDAVIISTPNKFHEGATVDALENGLDVMLEKPLAHDLASAERIANTAKKTGNICLVGYHHRYRNICQVTRSYIEKGYLGELTHINAKYIRRRGIPGRGTWFTSREIAGGGALIDIGAHLVDMLLFLAGRPTLDTVMAVSRSDFGHHDDYSYLHMWGEDDKARMYDVEDSVTAFCSFEDGLTVSIEVAWAANDTATHSYKIRGTEAGAHLDITNSLEEVDPVVDVRNELELYEARSGGSDHFVNSEVVAPLNNPYREEIDAFLSAVRSGERPARNNVEQALQVQQVIDRLYDASNQNDEM
ncbi:Gfo/Idh/MocA family protein [Haloarcula rubripromontorii]|uniref:Gfo/Idh/MocA family protein n=1 Tax=Haloarcula rubripromontorii TaxID=1705562 RepID=UPI00345B89C9